MSKKLLNESTIRRFGALANLNPNSTSNFIQGLDEEEEELDAIGDVDVEDEIILEPEEEEVEIEDSGLESVPADLTGVVKELVQVIADWAADQGVPVSVEGGDEEVIGIEDEEGIVDIDGEGELDLDIPAGEEEVGEPELELEEMIRQALSEATPEEEVIEEESASRADADAAVHDEDEGDRQAAADEAEDAAKAKKESIQLSDDVIKEVTRRVKARVAKLYKSKKA